MDDSKFSIFKLLSSSVSIIDHQKNQNACPAIAEIKVETCNLPTGECSSTSESSKSSATVLQKRQLLPPDPLPPVIRFPEKSVKMEQKPESGKIVDLCRRWPQDQQQQRREAPPTLANNGSTACVMDSAMAHQVLKAVASASLENYMMFSRRPCKSFVALILCIWGRQFRGPNST